MVSERGARAGLALALLSAGTFGTSGSFARSLTDTGWSPAAAVAARISAAALFLAAPALLSLRSHWHVLRRNLTTVATYGLVAVAGCQVCFFNAIQSLSIGVALLLEYLGTVLVVGWMWVRYRQRPRRLTGIGAGVALLGLVLVLDLIAGARVDPIGVLWGLGAACGLAVFFVLSSHVDGELPPVAMASAGMSIGAVTLLCLGGVGALPMHASFDTVTFAGHRVSWLVPVIGLSLVAAAIAYVAGIAAARLLGARLASFVGLTEVVFAVLVAWVLLGEVPSGVQLVGGALIVAGVALIRIDELRRQSTESSWRSCRNRQRRRRRFELTSPSGDQRKRGLVGDTDGRLDQSHEDLDISQEIIGFSHRERPVETGLGRGTLGGARGEEGSPLGQFGCHLGQQYPGIAGSTDLTRTRNLRSGPGGQDGSGAAQRRKVSMGISFGGS